MSKKLEIKQIAEELALSSTTVSRAFPERQSVRCDPAEGTGVYKGK